MTQVVVGLGLPRDATIEDVLSAIDAALAAVGCGWDDVVTVATTIRRREHPAIAALAEAAAVTMALFEPSDLARVTVPNPSAAVGEQAGTTSVAEAASLLAAGTDVVLLPKQIGAGVTVALAELPA